ncbi:unnamed protein product [Chondrus crispus]|uniref:Uncharacterized protein n=1 Tax=Chondrus crispus TaxID=2769 RepID=R7QDR4_CHOCR|nr:unnamed protein product [Chondrus crispus]CDF35581.1 unnamed protein product [Chondrus crispus]|eukprot:XP_005715400.1 unnamed protein product [Chondrus crispus]
MTTMIARTMALKTRRRRRRSSSSSSSPTAWTVTARRMAVPRVGDKGACLMAGRSNNDGEKGVCVLRLTICI